MDFGKHKIPLNTGFEFFDVFNKNFYHFEELQKLMIEYGPFPKGGGSYLMDGQTLDYSPIMAEKQNILFETVKGLKSNTNVIEVGVYAGHSLLIMLLAHPTINVDAIDIGIYNFTKPCVDYLNRVFNNRVRYFAQPSHDVLPVLVTEGRKYGLVHIDGEHEAKYIEKELDYVLELKNPSCYLVIDDWDGARHGMNKIEHLVNMVYLPSCIWRNAVYMFND